MEVKFSVEEANRLIKSMDSYCREVQQSARNLYDILHHSGEWNDAQMKAFDENMSALGKDLEQVLKFEGDYLRTFYQRIQELRG